MNDVLLNVENLSVAFKYERRYIPVTHDVSFQVRSGEILGLVGESGSGKSVTAKVIRGLLGQRARQRSYPEESSWRAGTLPS